MARRMASRSRVELLQVLIREALSDALLAKSNLYQQHVHKKKMT